MKRAEELSMYFYPPKMEYSSMIGVALNNKVDANIKLRDAFIKGYEQAKEDSTMGAIKGVVNREIEDESKDIRGTILTDVIQLGSLRIGDKVRLIIID